MGRADGRRLCARKRAAHAPCAQPASCWVVPICPLVELQELTRRADTIPARLRLRCLPLPYTLTDLHLLSAPTFSLQWVSAICSTHFTRQASVLWECSATILSLTQFTSHPTSSSLSHTYSFGASATDIRADTDDNYRPSRDRDDVSLMIFRVVPISSGYVDTGVFRAIGLWSHLGHLDHIRTSVSWAP